MKKEIEKLRYRVFENIGQERPDIEELTNKINEIIDKLNESN